jgi:glycosyltransferase 2 family protein
MPSWLPQALAYGLSAGCMAWVLSRYSFSSLKADLQTLDWRWAVLASLAELSVYVCQAWRWNTLLSPVVRLGFWRTVQAIYIGLFANEVAPLKIGEPLRCYLLAHWNNFRISLGFASAAVERLIDGFWMLLSLLVIAAFVKLPEDLTILVRILEGILLLGGLALIWVFRRRDDHHAVLEQNRWAATLRHVVEGLRLMGNWRTLTKTGLISLFFAVVQVVPVFALIRADHMDLSFFVACTVSVIIRLATFIPNAPGNLGVFNVACVAALVLFDVEPEVAKSFSLIMLGVLTLPLLIGGAVATALTGVKLGELRNRAHHSIHGTKA